MPEPLPVYTRLMARTAEMLALPHLACRSGVCRRKNACHWHFTGSREPCCLRNLTAGQRRLFDELYEQAIEICRHGSYWGLLYDYGDDLKKPLQDAGIEIARTIVPASDKRRFDAFRRKRARTDPPGPTPPAPRQPE